MPAPTVRYEQSALVGMRDSADPSLSVPDRCLAITNMYPLDPELGGGVIGRPGIQNIGGLIISSGYGQGLHQFTKKDGTEYTVAFAKGKFFTYNWATGVWTDQGTGGGLSADPAVRVFCVTFHDLLIVNPNDGVNKPWSWSGAASNSLTNASLAVGLPAVYYAKLFFVKWADRTTIIWSEEGQENTGYEAAGYNNAWSLQQTQDQGQIYALVGMNDALYYWRENSIGYVSGAVNSDFRSTGTRAGVSQTVGTKSPGAIVVHDQEIYFLDRAGRPHVLSVGGGVTPLWQDMAATLTTVQVSSLTTAIGLDYVPAKLVLFALPETGAGTTYPTLVISVNTTTKAFAGTMRFPGTGSDGYMRIIAAAIMKDGNNTNPTWVSINGNGYAYQHGDPQGTIWADALVAAEGGTTPIRHTVTGPAWGYDSKSPKRFDRMDVALVIPTDLTTVNVGLATPSGSRGLNIVSLGGGLWDIGLWDVMAWAPEGAEYHFAVGLDEYGRWGRPTITHASGSERLWLTNWSVSGFIEPDEPGII